LMARRGDGLAEAERATREAVPEARVSLHLGDCSDEVAVRTALGEAHAVGGRLDIAFASVGGGGFKPLLALTPDDLRREFELNVTTAFHVIRHGAPLMQRGGSIVCLSSSTGKMPFAYLAAYHIAKAALEGLVRGAAEELGHLGIRVNAVRPGMTRSGGTAPMFDSPAALAPFLAEYPLGRLGQPGDIAGAVRFLAGPESGWMTGQCFAVDGGNELRRNPDLTPMLEAMLGPETFAAQRAGKETVR
ncbi:MAG: SDR family oxidoreductase, partial [Novosphingobium sp.]|nr:SDR family oxidoreductase [Novosphingobium sp.]